MEADGRMDFVVDVNIVTPRVSVATSAILRRVLVLQKVNNMRSPPLEFSLYMVTVCCSQGTNSSLRIVTTALPSILDCKDYHPYYFFFQLITKKGKTSI